MRLVSKHYGRSDGFPILFIYGFSQELVPYQELGTLGAPTISWSPYHELEALP
jgi:hypothetical protein